MAAESVIGVDIDEASVRHAAARYPAMNLSFRCGSASQIPLADASVDVITSFETIEHLAEHELMLREMARVLRSNGLLMISSPNRLVYSDARGYSNPFHVRELYFHEFRDLLRGFFPEVHIYGQRIFAASALYPIGAGARRTRWIGPSPSAEPGVSGLPDPEYFIAICGRVAGEKLPHLSSVYLDLRDDLIEDVRSGGLITAEASVPMLSGGSNEVNPTLAIGPAADVDGEEARLRKQVEELERLRSAAQSQADAAEGELRAEACLRKQADDELERLRSAAQSQTDAAEGELRAVRRREAEGRLERENLSRQLRDAAEQLAATQQIAAAGEDWRLGFDLLAARLSGLQTALEDAKSQLDSMKHSKSWRVTAPLRQAISFVRGDGSKSSV
jgi:hypothetical protein